jgi:hypothetical protein
MEVEHMQMEEVVAVSLHQHMRGSTKQHDGIPRLGNLLRSHRHRARSRPLCQVAHCRNRGLVSLYCGCLSLDRPSLHPFFCLAHTCCSDCRPLVGILYHGLLDSLFLGLSMDLCPDPLNGVCPAPLKGVCPAPLNVPTVPVAVEVAGSLAVLSYAYAVSVSQARES